MCGPRCGLRSYIFLLSRNVVNKDFREVLVTDHQNLLDLIRNGDEDSAIRSCKAT